jgi:hypothetical protein
VREEGKKIERESSLFNGKGFWSGFPATVLKIVKN